MSATLATRAARDTAAIAASTTTTPRVIAQVVPADSTASRYGEASNAAESIKRVIDASSKAGLGVIAQHYGDVDLTAVKTALRIAQQLMGAPKARGNVQDTINRALKRIESVDRVTDTVLVAAARVALDENKQAAKARRDRKKDLAAQVNDSHATPEARAAALEVLAGMDAQDELGKRAAITERLMAALIAAHAASLTRADVVAMVNAEFGASKQENN